MYGVDECRRCGVTIIPVGSHEMLEHLAIMKSKKAMPEAQWRKMGLLAPPTPRQMRIPGTGCCYECGLKLQRQKTKPFLRLGKVIVGGIVAIGLFWIVGTYVEH